MLAILVLVFAGPWIVQQTVPMSRYYELRSVFVEDTVAGVSPHMAVDRTIHQDFRGRYDIEILRVQGSEFTVWWECGAHVSEWQTYRRTASLPENLTLDWWMGVPPGRPCPLPPGQYRVITTITAQGPLGAGLSVTTQSNVFAVLPPE